jgi:outer membrane receptor protein involved in Fe transport
MRIFRAVICLIPFSALISANAVMAQTASTPSTASQQQKNSGNEDRDAATILDPFEVVSDARDSYEAANLNSLTGTNKPLGKLPITAEILTAQLMSDLAVTNAWDAFRDVATGLGAPYNGAGSATQSGADGDARIPGGFKLRGLATPRPLRDGFLDAEGTMLDGLNLERAEIIRGPQALIYGPGAAGGILNLVTKQAHFGVNSAKVEFRTDSHRSLRGTIDVNFARQWRGHRVAVRAATTNDNTNYWRTNIGSHTHGYFVAGGVELFKETATTLRFQFEDIRSQQNTSTTASITGLPTAVANGTELRVLLAQNNPVLNQIDHGRISWDNVDSFGLESVGGWDKHRFIGVEGNSRIAPWLQFQIQGGRDFHDLWYMGGSSQTLTPPLTGANPLNEWAINYHVTGPKSQSMSDGVRATITADFPLTRFTKNNLIVGGIDKRSVGFNMQTQFFPVDASGNYIVNLAQINNAAGGRTAMANQWVSVEHGYGSFVGFNDTTVTLNGVTYRRDFNSYKVPSLASATNPQGWTGGYVGDGGTTGRARGIYAALFTEWLGGKIDTLASLREDDNYSFDPGKNLSTVYPFAGTAAYSYGAVWHALPYLSPYANWSTRKRLQQGSDLFRNPLPLGEGQALEAGLKFTMGSRLSGSAAYFRSKDKNEALTINNATLLIVDRASQVSGLQSSSGARLIYNPSSSGFEIALTAQPTRNWRMQLGYSHFQGTQSGDVRLPILYNDQFNTNSSGQVLLGTNGTPLRVPVDPKVPIAADGKTYAAGVATEVMTVSILKNGDANGNYKAQLDPSNGEILNAAALGMNIVGVATGVVGLPVSQNQLGFVSPLGDSFLALKGGDRLLGSPTNSVSFVNMYNVESGRFRGTSLGFSSQLRQGQVGYYYTDATGTRKLLGIPNTVLFNPIIGYRHAMGRKVTWRTQLNVNNVFDTVKVIYYPNLATGVLQNAALTGAPRTFILTTSFSY